MVSLLITLFLVPYVLSQLSFTLHQELTGTLQFAPSPPLPLSPSPALKARPTTVYRPRSLEALHRTRLRSLYHAQSELEPLIWDPMNISGPDIEDIYTLTQLSRMSANAYQELPEHWYEVDHAWNLVRYTLLLPFCLAYLIARVFHLVGRLRMVLGVMFFYPLTTLPLCFPSKARLFKVQHPSLIDSTTTCRFCSSEAYRS